MTIHSNFDWSEFADHWWIAPGCTYLNHGSFGPSPLAVQQQRAEYLAELESQPMSFLIRKLPDYLEESQRKLAAFLNAEPENIAFVPNATEAMNVVARNVDLKPDDEVLLTDHEYGAVLRLWNEACKKTGAKTTFSKLPCPLTSKEEIVETIFASISERTRVIVVSHITSPTAVILPVKEICAEARRRGIISVVDGPHAIAMLDLNLRSIDCDYYCASCHKWLSAPFASGFLYVRGRHKQGLLPNAISWGRSLSGREPRWTDEFHWPGTFDATPFLSIPMAIELLKDIGISRFREQTHALARYAREQLLELTDRPPLTDDSVEWYGSMVTVPFEPGVNENLKPGQVHPLQDWLSSECGIEVPLVEWHSQWYIRISCHLYNTPDQIERLLELLKQWQDRHLSRKT